MRDIKVVSYGNVSSNDERLIETYLEDKGMSVVIYSVDTARAALQRENAILRAKVVELESDG